MTVSLSLYFTRSKKLTLYRVKFRNCATSKVIHAYRGKDTSLYGVDAASFLWTTAVRGFSLLAVSFVLDGKANVYKLNSHSFLSALDYALSNPPRWLRDMFGNSKTDESFCKRIFKRVNPQQKLAGSAFISFNPELFSQYSVKIFLNGSEITDDSVLFQMQQELSGRFLLERKSKASLNISESAYAHIAKIELPAFFESQVTSDRFKSFFKSELLTTLYSSDIFSQSKTEITFKKLISDQQFLKIADKNLSKLSPLIATRDSGIRLGLAKISESTLKDSDPIRVSFPMGFSAAPAIFYYLKYIKKIPLEFDFNYQHAIAISKKILNHSFETPPDLCVLGSAPAATLISSNKKSDYEPWMLFPGMTHRLIGHKENLGQLNPLEGEIHALSETPSTSGFYLDSLLAVSPTRNSKVIHAEPDEISQALCDRVPNFKGMSYFPFYFLAQERSGAELLDQPINNNHIKDSVLMAHESIRKYPNKLLALEVAIRDAWLELREGGKKTEKVLDLIMMDREFLKAVQRFSGVSISSLSDLSHST